MTQDLASSPPTTFLTRIGLAIVRPQRALAIAGGRRHPGRSGSDLIALLLLALAATQLRALVGAVWMGAVVDLRLGVHATIRILTDTLTVDLAFLVIAAVLLWAVAGRRRDLGRAFDLACVAVLPLVLVQLATGVILRLADVRLATSVGFAVGAVAWTWTGVLVALAAQISRVTPKAVAGPRTPEEVAIGRWPGRAVLAMVVLGVALHVGWIATHLDLIRPVQRGELAPEIALPTIVDVHGTTGPIRRLSDSRGKVVVIDFWATWCRPCLKALPNLDRLAATYDDVEVLAVNLDDPAQAFAVFRDGPYHMTLLADDGATSERYGVTTIPHTVIVTRDGTVHEVFRGGHDIAHDVEQIRK